MAITWQNSVEKIVGDGLTSLSGSNVLFLSAIVGALFVWIMLKIGAPSEVVLPASLVFIIVMVMYLNILPEAIFAGALIVAAVVVSLAFNKVFRS